MDALHAVPPGERAEVRMELAQEAGVNWLTKQGEQHGFELLDATVADYRTVALPNHVGKRKGQPQFGVMEMTGLLRVTDPELFLAKLATALAGRGRSAAG